MTPISLKLVHFIGIKDGLDRDELFIDFTKLESGVVGIIGDTGSGKTVLAESMTPFLSMMTRDGALQRHCYGDKAEKEFIFSVNGVKYKSLVIINPKKAILKPYLYQDVDNEWLLITDKKKEYEAAIVGLLGTFDSFKRSVFTPQGDTPIIVLKDAELKRMFIEMFDFGKYEREYLPVIKQELTQINTEITTAKGFIAAFTDKQENLKTKKTELKIIDNELSMLRLNFNDTKRAEDIAEKNVEAQQKVIKNIQKQRNDARELELKASELKREINNIVNDHVSKTKEIEVAITSNKKDLDNHKNTLAIKTNNIDRYKKIVENKQQITDKYNEYNSLLSESDKLKLILKEISENKAQQQIIISEIKTLENNLSNLELQYKSNETRALLLQDVPCVGMDINSSCKLLNEANQAKQGLGAISNKIATVKKNILVEQEKLQQLISINKNETETNSAISKIERQADILFQEKWISLYNEIEIAETAVMEFEEEALKIQEQIKTCEIIYYELKQKLSSKAGEIDDKTSGLKTELKSVEAKINSITELLNPIQAEELLDEYKYKLSQARNTSLYESNKITELTTKLTFYNNEISDLENEISKIQGKKQAIDILLKDFEEWKILERAIKEIPVLELESASIILTDFVNDLLSDVFDYDISIKVITIMPKLSKSGEDKEVFKIMVYKDGVEVLPKNLSGGQKQMIDSAFRMGIELTIRQASTFKHDTSIFDEADSAIDTKRAIDFFDMVKKVHNINNKKFTFIISHRTEVKNQLDQIIDMSKFKR